MVAVPVNAKLHPRELAFVLGDAEASCLFISDDLAPTTIPVIEGMPTLRKTLTPAPRNTMHCCNPSPYQ